MLSSSLKVFKVYAKFKIIISQDGGKLAITLKGNIFIYKCLNDMESH